MHAVITGISSGFGQALCERLLHAGASVTAVERPGQEVLLASERLEIRRCDLAEGVPADLLTDLEHVDLLVNNAGYAVFGTVDTMDMPRFAAMLAVNVLALHDVTRQVLPALRAASGTVVNLSSVAGRMVFPESGAYAATKHAVEAISEATFLENCRHGVRVRVIEPGSFNTGFGPRATEESPPRDPASWREKDHAIWDDAKWDVLETTQGPEMVASAVLESLGDARPFLRVPVGVDGQRLMALRSAMSPDGWVGLMAARNGAPAFGDVLTPEEVGRWEQAPPARQTATLAAWRLGHLSHWTQSPAGAKALRTLALVG